MRVSLRPEESRELDTPGREFNTVAERFGTTFEHFEEAIRRRAVVMVSRFGHCQNYLLCRWRIGALPIDTAAVI